MALRTRAGLGVLERDRHGDAVDMLVGKRRFEQAGVVQTREVIERVGRAHCLAVVFRVDAQLDL